MNRLQKFIAGVMGVTILGMALYPPWYVQVEMGKISRGYGWITQDIGAAGHINAELLLAQVIIVALLGLIVGILVQPESGSVRPID